MELGKIQILPVCRLTKNGARLGDEEDNVLLPGTEMPKDLKEGDEIKVFVYRDSEDRPIATSVMPPAQVGEAAVMTVRDITRFGAYLNWGLAKDLFLPFGEQNRKIQVGDRVVVFVYLDKSERLCGTMRVYDHLTSNSTYEADDVVNGIVYGRNPDMGVFVAVDGKYHGMVQKKELVRDLRDGEKITARVKSVRADGKLDLAIRNKSYLQIDADADIIYSEIVRRGGSLGYGEKVAAEVIRGDFAMSKSEFKRAIGRLLKDGRIKIVESDICIKK